MRTLALIVAWMAFFALVAIWYVDQWFEPQDQGGE